MDLPKIMKWFRDQKKSGYTNEQLLASLKNQGYNEDELYLIEKTVTNEFSYFFMKFVRFSTLLGSMVFFILAVAIVYMMRNVTINTQFKPVLIFCAILFCFVMCSSVIIFIFYYRILANTFRKNILKMFVRPIFIIFYIFIIVCVLGVNIFVPKTSNFIVPLGEPQLQPEYQATPGIPVKVTPPIVEINITKQENSKKIIFSMFNTLDNNSIQPSFSWCESLNETTNASYSTEDYELISPAVNLSVNQVTNLMVLIKVKPNALKAGNSAVCHVKVKITDYAIISPVSINIVD